MSELHPQQVAELQKVIFAYFGPTYSINSYKSPDQQDQELAEAILAAGYYKCEHVEES